MYCAQRPKLIGSWSLHVVRECRSITISNASTFLKFSRDASRRLRVWASRSSFSSRAISCLISPGNSDVEQSEGDLMKAVAHMVKPRSREPARDETLHAHLFFEDLGFRLILRGRAPGARNRKPHENRRIHGYGTRENRPRRSPTRKAEERRTTIRHSWNHTCCRLSRSTSPGLLCSGS